MLSLLTCAAAFGGTKPATLSQTFKRGDDAVALDAREAAAGARRRVSR
jgi:hypothetical protein